MYLHLNIRYNESNISGSLNIHTLDLKLEKHIDNSLMHKSELSVLYNNKGKIITVVGDNDKKTSEVRHFRFQLYITCGPLFFL